MDDKRETEKSNPRTPQAESGRPEDKGPEMSSDQPSPADSPRDKRQRTEEEVGGESPGTTRRNLNPQRNLLVAASPPKFVSFEEIMKAANGVSNMSLAHEIAVDNEFKFEKSEPESNSIEKKVRDIMHKAFWDTLQEKLREDPPDFSHAMVLLQEVKENLEELLLPHHHRLRSQIAEVIDLDLVEQQAEAGTLDFQHYANFVVDVMAKLCAPARDDTVAKLRDIKDIVPLYKEIFAVLDVMKMDMANFTIQQIRPYLQQQSVSYERTKFSQLLKTQEESGQDGLQFTKVWLTRNARKLFSKAATNPPSLSSPPEDASAQPGGAASQSQPSTKPTPNLLLNSAYLEILDWEDSNVYPETLLMDEHRFRDLKEKTEWLTLVSSVVLVTYNTVGASIAGVSALKTSLKQHIAAIMEGLSSSNRGDVMVNVATQVIQDVDVCLGNHGYPLLPEDKKALLRGQVEGVASPQHPVHNIVKSRLFTFIQGFIASPNHNQPIQIPPGFSSVSEELSHVCGRFMRLVAHNRNVFGLYYADIIGALLREHEEGAEREGKGEELRDK